VNCVGQGGRRLSAFQFSASLNSSGSLAFSGNFVTCANMGLSVISAQGLAADQLLGGEKNGIVYRSFCIVMTIVIITNSSSIYSIALLNCLYLNP